jgi:hypothetical protein
MIPTNDLQSETPDPKVKKVLPASNLGIQLAASIVDRLIERNAGRVVADAFWDDDTFEALDGGDEYLDPELWDPDEETLPEMDIINWNIYECN